MVPDAENDLRKQQLRELALLNGTLRENDALLYDDFLYTASVLSQCVQYSALVIEYGLPLRFYHCIKNGPLSGTTRVSQYQ